MKIHILEKTNKSYKVIIHFPALTETNLAKVKLKDVMKIKPSVLEGIDKTENDSIVAGDTIEIVRTIDIDGEVTDDALNKLADIAINEFKEKTKDTLKLYGYSV